MRNYKTDKQFLQFCQFIFYNYKLINKFIIYNYFIIANINYICKLVK